MTTPPLKASLGLKELLLKGRIESMRRSKDGKKTFTRMTSPGVDEYSRPDVFLLQSDGQVGGVGDVILCKVTVSGFVRDFQYRDKQNANVMHDGEESNVFFDFVAHVQENKAA